MRGWFYTISSNIFLLDAQCLSSTFQALSVHRKKKKMRKIAIELQGQEIRAYGSDGDKRRNEEKGKRDRTDWKS